jgi:PAS domain S-box-containing protein
VRKGDAAMLRRVSEGFAAIDAGELKQIDEKWFGRTLNRYGRYLTYAGYAAAVALLLIAGLVGWNRTLRKRIAQRTAELGESEQRFRQIAENIREVFWMSTGDFGAPLFTMLYISPAYESVWGRTCESLYRDPHSFIDAIHPDDRARVADVNERDQEQGFEIEYRVVRPDGSMRWIRDRGFPIKDAAGRFYRLTGIAEDITERKQAEEALDERLRFETLLAELSASFANLSRNEVDREIDKWLQTLVEFLGVDRASFFQFEEDWTTLYRSHSYTVPGVEPLPQPIGMKDQFPWITDQLRRGVTVKWSRIPDDMPEDAVKEKEYAARLGAKSGLNIPVRMGGSVICAITFTSIATYHDWPDAMVARLRLIGEIFAAAVERKRAEAALRKSEEQFRQMAENIREVFWMSTADLCNTLYISPAYETVWGRSCESLYREPRSFFAAIHSEDRPGVIAIVERDREQGFEVEYRVVRPDGSFRWIWDRGFPINDELGRFYRVAGIAEDVTDRKEAEALLFAKEQEFRAIVENAPDLIARYDREFRRTYANPALAKSYDLPAEALIGKPMSTLPGAGLDVKEDELAIRQRFEDVFDSGKSCEFEVTLSMPTGRRYFSVRFFPELNVNGSVINVLSIARDITASKRAEEELKKEKEILEKIFDNIPLLIGFVGEDGRVKLVNPEWERTMGWTLKELQDQNVDIFAEAYPDLPYRQEVLDFVAAATGEWVDLKIRVRDGRLIDAACAVVHLSDGTKVAIAQDITDRKQAEERLNATTEQLRALSASVQSAKEEEGTRIAREIHDELGGALTSLKWDLESFHKVISESNHPSLLQALHGKVEAMLRLSETTISAVRRISSELRPSVLDDLGLAAAIEWQARQFQTRTGIICHCECSVENLDLDQEQSTAIFRILQEALTNILRHAQATRVEIAINEEAGEIVLTVSDNGRGITEDEKSRLQSLGLLGMRERAYLIGGEIDVIGVEARGTVVTVRVPNAKRLTTAGPSRE